MRHLLVLALLAGCPTPREGTIELGLTSAPGSPLLDSVVRLRVTLTNPLRTTQAERGPDGFALSLDVEADGSPGAIVVEGFDANDLLVAGGQSPEFSIAAIDARVVVYMAEPMSLGRAPVSVSPARENVSSASLTYGVIFAGGRDAAGVPSDAIAIYNAYDHTLAGGKPMPAPRDGIVVASSSTGVYLYGGRDAAGNPTGTSWLFDTITPPSGLYYDLGDHPGLTKADEIALALGGDTFIVTGSPPLDLQGAMVQARSDLAGLAPVGTTHVRAGVLTALTLDSLDRLTRFHDNMFEVLAPVRGGCAIADLPDGRFVVVGGGTVDEADDFLVVDTAGSITTVADALTVPRSNASVAVTRRHIVVVGGAGPTEIFDIGTFARVATLPAIEGTAIALPNDQVLILDAVTGELSLFTPPPGV